MTNKSLSILASILGIASAFMPWIYYPKPDMSLAGYVGDGIIVILFFIVTLIIDLVSLKSKKQGGIFALSFPIVTGIISGSMAIFKILSLKKENGGFVSENYAVNNAISNYEVGYGLYVLLLASILLILFKVISLKTIQNEGSKRRVSITSGIVAILALICGCYFYYSNYANSSVDQDQVKISIEQALDKMGESLLDGDYETFISYNHPIMISSMGGKEKMKDLVLSTTEELTKRNNQILSINFSELETIHRQGSNYQALVYQDVVFNNAGNEKVEHQKMIAVSEDGGSSWTFINVSNGKPANEIRRLYPQLHNAIEF